MEMVMDGNHLVHPMGCAVAPGKSLFSRHVPERARSLHLHREYNEMPGFLAPTSRMLRRRCIELCAKMNAMFGYVLFVAAALWVTYGASTGH